MNRVKRVVRTLATRRLTLTFDRLEFAYTDLSPRRLLNWLLAELSYLAKTDRAWAYPTHLQVEPSNACNLRCPVCHVVTDGKPQGLLKFADFKQVIDEVGDYLLFLHFWGWGEPFMNPDFLSMVRYAKDRGLKIITSTNGHFFQDEQNIDRLIDSGLDALIFALDGVDGETYERYRNRGDFGRVTSGLQRLLDRRREVGSTRPLINLRMLVTRDNEHQVPQMKILASSGGVDTLTLKTLNSFDNEADGQCLIPAKPEYRRYRYDEMGCPVRIANPCKKLWNHPALYRDGTVVPCDYHTGLELSMGNLFTGDGRSFRDVWFGEEYRQLRSRFARGDRAGLRCSDCALNFADVDRCVSHSFQFAN